MTEFVGTFEVGEIKVSMISDGVSMAPRGPSWFTGIDPAEWMPAIGVDEPDALLPVNFGAFVIEGGVGSDGIVTLVDSGFGEMAAGVPGMEGAGGMLDQLATLGIEPGDVGRIIQTHLHADHCGWLIRATDQPDIVFPNAEVVVHRDEVAYWRSDDAEKNLAPAYTRARLEAVADAGLLRQIDGEVDLGGGVTVIPSPGHTPGHVSVMVGSGNERALLLGDVAHHCIHLEQHTWLQNYDVDPPTSIATRGRLAALAVQEGAVVTAPHMPVLTLVRLEHDGERFRYRAA
jgi:glyoxylase-like metal-dependent hydrolase (beta-lactamase superfamily II)